MQGDATTYYEAACLAACCSDITQARAIFDELIRSSADPMRSDSTNGLGVLSAIEGDVVDIHALKNAGLITRNIATAKIMLSGEITRPITVRGLGVTKGARAAIEAAGGKIEE